MDADAKARKVVRLVLAGDAHDAAELIEELVAEHYATAYFLKGMLYMKGGRDFAPDPERAIGCFRQNALRNPCTISSLYMARALLNAGGKHHAEAYRWLTLAAEDENPPETTLGFARFHETRDPPDYALARKLYLRAGLRGRFAGFIHLARLQRLQGERWRGALTITTLWLVSPLWYLRFGLKARNIFWYR